MSQNIDQGETLRRHAEQTKAALTDYLSSLNVIDFQLIPETQDLQTSLLRLLFKPNQKK